MQKTKINWADSVWNPITGCSPISAGCERCYARRMATRLHGRFGYPDKNPFRVTLHPDKLLQPLSTRKPRRIFISSMSDWMHPDVPDDYRDKMLAVMALTPWHTYYTLTKRVDNLLRYFDTSTDNREEDVSRQMIQVSGGKSAGLVEFPLPNVILGVTAENQAAADERIPLLLQTPAAVRFVSIEPMLGPVNLVQSFRKIYTGGGVQSILHGYTRMPTLDWVIVGGETGPGARPMHPDWVRRIRNDCAVAGVPFFFKGWGDWFPIYGTGRLRGDEEDERTPFVWVRPDGTMGDPVRLTNPAMLHVGTKAAGRVLDGKTHDARPNRRKEKDDE